MSTSPEEAVEEFANNAIAFADPARQHEFWDGLAQAFAENAKGVLETHAEAFDVYPCGYCEDEFESEEERTEHMAECPDREGADR